MYSDYKTIFNNSINNIYPKHERVIQRQIIINNTPIHTTFTVYQDMGHLMYRDISPIRKRKHEIFGDNKDYEWDFIWKEVCKNVECEIAEFGCRFFYVLNPSLKTFTSQEGNIFTVNYEDLPVYKKDKK